MALLEPGATYFIALLNTTIKNYLRAGSNIKIGKHLAQHAWATELYICR